MNTSSKPSELWVYAQALFERLRRELAEYGLEIEPRTHMLAGDGLLCCYDLTDGQIYLSLPDTSTPLGIFQAAVFRSVLGCKDDAELAEFVRLLLPWLVAHELGHYFRHQYGRFGTDLWYEEQLANQFAAALTLDHLSAQDRASLIAFLRRSLEVLVPKMDSEHVAVESYLDPLQAIGATGILSQASVRGLELLEGLFSVPPEEILSRVPRIPAAISERLSQRDSTIQAFNEEYASGVARYAYFQFGWMLIAFESAERHYVDEFARNHLGQGIALLPNIPSLVVPEAPQIRALYSAHRELQDMCPALGQYFFKRYRASLLERFAVIQSRLSGATKRLGVSVWRILESQDEEDARTLDYLSALAPRELKPLFPNSLVNEPLRAQSADGLLYETDLRLYRHATACSDDSAAAATLERLIQLNASELFRALPAELLIELTHLLHCVRVPAGYTLIRQGSPNDDVFIIVSGAFDVVHERDGVERPVRRAEPGEVVGEMAFITGASRSATLRAAEPSVCFVLRAATLKLFAYENPVLLMQMARVLGWRLNAALTKPM